MDVLLPKPPVREMTPTLFSDITPLTYEVIDNMGEYTLRFAGNLTEQEARWVTWRATLTATDETLLRQAESVLPDLRLVRDSTGTLTTAQLSSAVRLLARVEVGLVRKLIGDLSGTS